MTHQDEIPIVFAYNINTVLASRNEAIHVAFWFLIARSVLALV